ncbi:MFS transporter [Patescibacteria group bacterium]|nr:MFS transporter [Patescibacteria group bacterium]
MADKRLWIIFLIIFVNLLGFGIILPLLPYYVESFGAGPLTIGLISAAYSLFQLLSSPILGELSDKYGRRPILLFSIGGTTLSFLLLGLAKSVPVLFLARIVDGASGGNISTAQAYIADVTTKENRTQSMGVMMAAFSLGFILGPALGGFLSRYGYAVPAFVAAFAALVATLLTYFFLPESRRESHSSANRSPKPKLVFNFQDFIDALTHPEVGLLLTISFLTMLAFSLMQGTFALFTQHSLGLDAAANGFLFAYLGIVGILLQLFFLKKILSWLSENQIIVFSLVGMALSLVLIAYSSTIFILILAVTILAVSNNLSGPVLAGLISKLTPDTEQGNIMGTSQSVGSLARLIGPITGTFFYSALGIRSPYLIAAVVLILTFVYAAKSLR